jgi:hypothetical protein
MEVRSLPLQQIKAFLNFQGGFFMTIRGNADDEWYNEQLILKTH